MFEPYIGPYRLTPTQLDRFARAGAELVSLRTVPGRDEKTTAALCAQHLLSGAPKNPSLHNDLKNGTRLHVECLAGGALQLGRKTGVPTPCNRAIWDGLALYANGRKG